MREQLLRRIAEGEREVHEFVRAEKALVHVFIARVELAVLVLREHEALREPCRHQQRQGAQLLRVQWPLSHEAFQCRARDLHRRMLAIRGNLYIRSTKENKKREREILY